MNERDTELLNAYFDQRLTNSQREELQERLQQDPALAETLLEASIDEARISAWAKSSTSPSPSGRHALLAEFAQLDDEKRQVRTRQKYRTRFIVAITLSLALIAATSIWLNWPPTVATITAEASCVGLPPMFGFRTIGKGRRLAWSGGILELETPRGVRLVLEGPCDLIFESEQHIRLTAGKLYAEVSKAGRSFTVTTPDGELVDLGTRFGVAVVPGNSTELHVFEGLVTAQLHKNSHELSQVESGTAVVVDAQSRAIDPIEIQHKFAQSAAPFAEHFRYHSGPIAGKSGWIARGTKAKATETHSRGMKVAGLARGSGDSLELNPLGRSSDPVGHRWHHRFMSAVIWLDDDFPKQMARQKVTSATLCSFETDSGDTLDSLRLVVRPKDNGARFQAGLAQDKAQFAKHEMSHKSNHFVVVELGEDAVRLWVDPSAEHFSSASQPDPDAEIPRPAGFSPTWFWLGNEANPKFAWFKIDAIRGGETWADVTPGSEE